MGLQESEFLSQGGDREWLQGLEHVPPKIQDLYELIKLLSHRPWLITQELIEKLLKGPHNWTLSELVQACVLISHFTSLPSFIYGCGINPEIDMDGGHTLRPPSLTDESGLSNNNKPNEESAGGNVEELVQKMKNIEKQSDTEDSQEEKVKKFEKVREQSGKYVAIHGVVNRTANKLQPRLRFKRTGNVGPVVAAGKVLGAEYHVPPKPYHPVVLSTRPPNSDRENLQQLSESLQYISRSMRNSTILVAGDFNLPHIDWSNRTVKPYANEGRKCSCLLDICNHFYSEQMVKEPTRTAGATENILDLVLTTHPAFIDEYKVTAGISDHDIVSFRVNQTPSISRKKARKVFMYNKADTTGMRADLLKF
eukprot:XP_011683998.1 PREDICTED: uncharacterized protein LOC105447523 [Strongylocentrotus purpuratus]